MIFKLKTAPAAEPISLTEAKLHLRLATTAVAAAAYTTEDDWLTRSISAVRRQAELETGRAFVNQTWYGYLNEWPDVDYIEIPKSPLVSATITYRNEDDTGYDNTFTDFATDAVSEPGRLVLTPDESWPTDTLYPVNPIQVEFICGYGAAGSNVPEPIRAALLLMLSDMYENRGEVVIGVSVSRITEAIDNLLRNYRVWSLK